MNAGYIVLIVIGGLLLIFLTTLFILLPKKAYFTAFFSFAYVSVFKAISMKLRKLDVEKIVDAYILAKKSKLAIPITELEVIATSGGHPMRIVEGLNAAKSAKLKIDMAFAKAVDVSGRDLVEVVREFVNPKLIEVPLITAASKDNVEVNVKISLTLKLNVAKFLTGVTEETISARAVEAVVTKIANTDRASLLVSQPQLIDKTVFEAEVDDDAQYELVSVDVIHIDLGKNRNLDLEKEQIEKNRILGVNQLEQRRLMAVALEQEMKAKAEENRAKMLANEAEVPKAVVQAIKDGKMKDVVDYFKLQNLQADTEMRRQFISKDNRPDDF